MLLRMGTALHLSITHGRALSRSRLLLAWTKPTATLRFASGGAAWQGPEGGLPEPSSPRPAASKKRGTSALRLQETDFCPHPCMWQRALSLS